MLIAIFLLAGACAAVAGGLFATLQTYITPDAFTFDLSVLFFIAILIGGRGSILGPLLGTVILTILPEIAAPLAAWSTFLYAVLLLLIVLVMPGGIAALLDFRNRRPLASNRAIVPRPAALADIVRRSKGGTALSLRGISLSFGNVQGDRRPRPRRRARPDPRPDRPERQRQDHDAQRHLRLLRRQGRHDDAGRRRAAAGHAGVARDPRHRPHLPDPARGRRSLGAAERHDRRHGRGQGDLPRGAAGAAAQPPGRADARREGARAARRRRPRNARRCPRRPAAAQRAALHRDRARADARSGFSAARRTRRRPLQRRDRAAGRTDQGDQPRAAPACCWSSITPT